jgi:hypothetical protein
MTRYTVQARWKNTPWRDTVWFSTHAHAAAYLGTFTPYHQRQARIVTRVYHWSGNAWVASDAP